MQTYIFIITVALNNFIGSNLLANSICDPVANCHEFKFCSINDRVMACAYKAISDDTKSYKSGNVIFSNGTEFYTEWLHRHKNAGGWAPKSVAAMVDGKEQNYINENGCTTFWGSNGLVLFSYGQCK